MIVLAVFVALLTAIMVGPALAAPASDEVGPRNCPTGERVGIKAKYKGGGTLSYVHNGQRYYKKLIAHPTSYTTNYVLKRNYIGKNGYVRINRDQFPNGYVSQQGTYTFCV